MQSGANILASDPPQREAALGVSVRGLKVVFPGERVAFHAIDLDIAAGSFVALVGPSGCGKTTLLRALGGLVRPQSGTLAYQREGQTSALLATDLGFCFQEPRLVPWRCALDNVALPLELRDVAPLQRRKAAMHWLTRVGLRDAAELRPHELSGGMRMRVAVARALITQPRLLLLDEPFGALDEIGRAELDDLLYELWQSSAMTVVLVTHSLAQATFLAQEVCIMSPSPGTIVHRAVPGFVTRNEDIRATAAFAQTVASLHGRLHQAIAAGGVPA